MTYSLHCMDCRDWLRQQTHPFVHAILTDPPFGVEFQSKHINEKSKGNWRIPPPGRRALPRFSVLTKRDLVDIEEFFTDFAELLFPVLLPGAHVLIASNPLISQFVWMSLLRVGFEKRGEIVRLVQTLRGGDRPKGAEEEFSMVSVMPRSSWEPWGLFRKPCEGTVANNLRKYGVGGLRRISRDQPFKDVIFSSFPTKEERVISDHPTLKPQTWLRPLVQALLPQGGVLLDPFMGSGSTIAAAEALEFDSIGIEINPLFFDEVEKNIRLFRCLADDLQQQDFFDFAMSLDS